MTKPPAAESICHRLKADAARNSSGSPGSGRGDTDVWPALQGFECMDIHMSVNAGGTAEGWPSVLSVQDGGFLYCLRPAALYYMDSLERSKHK